MSLKVVFTLTFLSMWTTITTEQKHCEHVTVSCNNNNNCNYSCAFEKRIMMLTLSGFISSTNKPSLNLMSINAEDFKSVQIFKLLENISSNAFENFDSLESLEISDNSIKKIYTGTFTNLRHLAHLDLSQNEIESIEVGSFSNLPALQLLLLNGNNLRRISGIFDYLSNVTSLNIANNMLTTFVVRGHNALANLFHLDLSNNRIKEYWTPTLTNLHVLDLHQNLLTDIPSDMFEGLTELLQLDLNSNQIEVIEAEAFAHISLLRYLVLSNNSIRMLSENILPPAGGQVKVLKLHGNRLQFLPLKFFVGLSKLRTITLQGNPWNCGCLDDLLSWIDVYDVQIDCRAFYFNGNVPVCAVHPGEKNFCSNRYYEKDAELFVEYESKNPNYYLKLPGSNSLC